MKLYVISFGFGFFFWGGGGEGREERMSEMRIASF